MAKHVHKQIESIAEKVAVEKIKERQDNQWLVCKFHEPAS